MWAAMLASVVQVCCPGKTSEIARLRDFLNDAHTQIWSGSLVSLVFQGVCIP
jgi:hypothetical protein